MTSPFPDSKEHPIVIRVGGEHHDATTPLTRTSANYESVLVAHGGDCALRIGVDGYRVLKRTRPHFWSTIQSARVAGLGLQSKSAAYALLDMLQADAVFSPADIASVKAASEVWPDRADVAWRHLHAGEAIPAFAPHITGAHRRYMQGV